MHSPKLGYNPLRWNCAERGCFNTLKRPKIEVFAEALPKRMAFSDVDAITEYRGHFLMMEWKSYRGDIPTGQRIMFERLTVPKRDTTVFVGFVGDHIDAPRALGPHALRDLHHAVAFGSLAHALAAGHGHRVVVQNFVGDVDPGSDALAHRQHAAVKVSAVANVGKHVGVVAEGLLAHPGHALAAHLGKAGGAAVHPQRHEVATNAGHGARALGHAGAGVVRATGAKPRLAIGLDFGDLHGFVLGVEHRELGVDA